MIVTAILAICAVWTSDASAADCVNGGVYNFQVGKPATVILANRCDHPVKVSFCAYRVYIAKPLEGWGYTQTLFAQNSVIIQPREINKALTVNTDICRNQVDAFEGECPDLSLPGSEKGFIEGLMGWGELCKKACVNECSVEGKRECYGNGWRECRKAADGCLKWSPVTDCEPHKKCEYGNCIISCTDECSIKGQRVCVGNGWKECGNFDNDPCLEWGPRHDCENFKTCSNGSCNLNPPTVDLKSIGSVACNRNATLTWTSTNATACYASGSWFGGKAVSGSETAGNFTGTRTFILTCSNSEASASDSVTLNGSEDTLNVSAGSDMEVDAGRSIELNGSVSGSGSGGAASISWSCTGGTLSNRVSLTPAFRADSADDDRIFTCTITATNECGSDSDSMKVRVNKKEVSDFDVDLTARPKSDCAPMNDVDLIAKLSNYGGGNYNYTYYFDCDNDGDWEKTVTTDNTTYTALNLCDYRNIGNYTAKVRVTASGRTATDTASVKAIDCRREKPDEDCSVSITKNVRNITGGTGFSGSVAANPGDTLSYRIVVTGVSGRTENITVSDILPNGIVNVRDVRTDGYGQGGSLSVMNIGPLSSGQTKTITYTANVASEYNFSYGQTTLTNTATVSAGSGSTSANAAVNVYRRAVQGATTISTGFGGNMFAGLVAALIGLTACAGWLLKDQIFAFFRKDPARALRQKIAFIKQNGLAR